jgi:hypothetical protein
LHCGTPSCRRKLTSSWIHNFPGSFPSFSGGAPRPNCRPYAASSVLRPTSLWLLSCGFLDAPLWTAIIPGSGLVSVASLQAVVSSNSDRTGCIAVFFTRWMVSFNSEPNVRIVDLISAIISFKSPRSLYRWTILSAFISAWLASRIFQQQLHVHSRMSRV